MGRSWVSKTRPLGPIPSSPAIVTVRRGSCLGVDACLHGDGYRGEVSKGRETSRVGEPSLGSDPAG